jgi:hypothetical protein
MILSVTCRLDEDMGIVIGASHWGSLESFLYWKGLKQCSIMTLKIAAKSPS